MVTPSKSLITDSLFDAVNEWLQRMCDSVSVAAGEAYAAGEFHAVGQLRAGVSFDVVQKDALEYAKTYRQNLVEHGEIQVSKIQYGSDGKPLLNKNGTIMRRDETVKWLTGSNQKISNDIAEIIQRGISEGKATGVRQLASGGYPAGSIAEELNQYLSGYKSRASTIARTETARNYYHGEQNRYAKAGVRYVQYLAAPDACEECLPYAGEVFELGTEPPLPIHPNCRCDYRPLSPNDAAYPEDAAGENDEITVPEEWEEIGVEPEISIPESAKTTSVGDMSKIPYNESMVHYPSSKTTYSKESYEYAIKSLDDSDRYRLDDGWANWRYDWVVQEVRDDKTGNYIKVQRYYDSVKDEYLPVIKPFSKPLDIDNITNYTQLEYELGSKWGTGVAEYQDDISQGMKYGIRLLQKDLEKGNISFDVVKKGFKSADNMMNDFKITNLITDVQYEEVYYGLGEESASANWYMSVVPKNPNTPSIVVRYHQLMNKDYADTAKKLADEHAHKAGVSATPDEVLRHEIAHGLDWRITYLESIDIKTLEFKDAVIREEMWNEHEVAQRILNKAAKATNKERKARNPDRYGFDYSASDYVMNFSSYGTIGGPGETFAEAMSYAYGPMKNEDTIDAIFARNVKKYALQEYKSAKKKLEERITELENEYGERTGGYLQMILEYINYGML